MFIYLHKNSEMLIEICDKLAEKLLKFCELNGLDSSEYAERAIQKHLMVDMYGNTPFSTKESYYERKKAEKDETTTTTTRKPRAKRTSTTTTTEEPVKPAQSEETVQKPETPIRTKRRL